jgi:hypothetical protein
MVGQPPTTCRGGLFIYLFILKYIYIYIYIFPNNVRISFSKFALKVNNIDANAIVK